MDSHALQPHGPSLAPVHAAPHGRRRRLGLALVLALAAALGAAIAALRQATPGSTSPAAVIVSIPPLLGIIQPLLDDPAAARSIMRAGQSEHGYEPSTGDARTIASARVLITVSDSIDGQIARMLRPPTRLVQMNRLVGPAGATGDQHLWLDPTLVRTFAEAAYDELEAAGVAVVDRASLEAHLARIDAVDRDWRTVLAARAPAGLITHHGAWSRPITRYGLEVAGVIHEHAELEAGSGDVARAFELVESGLAVAVFTEPQLRAELPRRIAAGRVPMGVLDPLGDGDWFGLMRDNLAELARVLPERSAPDPAVTGPTNAGE